MQRIFENPHNIGAQIIAYKTFGTDNQIKTLFAGERVAVKLKAAEARKISVNHKTGTAAAVRTLSGGVFFVFRFLTAKRIFPGFLRYKTGFRQSATAAFHAQTR